MQLAVPQHHLKIYVDCTLQAYFVKKQFLILDYNFTVSYSIIRHMNLEYRGIVEKPQMPRSYEITKTRSSSLSPLVTRISVSR